MATPRSTPSKRKIAAAPSVETPRPRTIEQRTAYLEERLKQADPAVLTRYKDDLDCGWIRHNASLEGTIYSPEELRAAIGPDTATIPEALQPAVVEIRRHREAINFIRHEGVKQPITLDILKRIYCILHPEEGDIKTVKYRRDIPQHRLYVHDYAEPDKIPQKLKALIDWLDDPETVKSRTPVRVAVRAHYDFIRIFPFQTDSGKVGRLFLNLLLLKAGYPPAIIHETERQRYYDALRGSPTTMNHIVQDSIDSTLAWVEKLVESFSSRSRSDWPR